MLTASSARWMSSRDMGAWPCYQQRRLPGLLTGAESTPGGSITKCHCKFSLSCHLPAKADPLIREIWVPRQAAWEPCRQSWGWGLPQGLADAGWDPGFGPGRWALSGSEAGRAVRVHLQAGWPPLLSSLRVPGPGLRPAVKVREPSVTRVTYCSCVSWVVSGAASHRSARGRWALHPAFSRSCASVTVFPDRSTI